MESLVREDAWMTPELVLVLARRGAGKTTLAGRLAGTWDREHVYVHDPMSQFVELPEAGPEALYPGALLVLDEVDMLATQYKVKHSWLVEALHRGRHYGVTVIGCARRPANVHNDVLGLASTVYLGQVTLEADLNALAGSYGPECYQAADLPPYQFMVLKP